MSQQTQIIRVVPKYEAWMLRFPTITSLAEASVGEVLKYWSGLGYNRRAINLHKLAKVIVSHHKGIFPRNKEQLLELPGIGEYTASAIACFAFDQQLAVVDTNVRKVILLLLQNKLEIRNPKFEGNTNVKETKTKPFSDLDKYNPKDIQDIAQRLLPHGKAYEWNQALMDYAGAMLKQEKIPVKKQSKFVGSNRYYRGQIVKYLLEYHAVSSTQLATAFGMKKEIVEKIIEGLIADGLVSKYKDTIRLP